MKTATSLSIGDRDVPLEADISEDFTKDHSIVGRSVEVSPVAGGELQALQGKLVQVTGVVLRLGEVAGYEVVLEGGKYHGSPKDFMVDRGVLEDIQPPTATSVAVREGLTHWNSSRTYWHERIDGFENLCFELASTTLSAAFRTYGGGVQYVVPEPLGDQTVVDCRVIPHDNFWNLGVQVYSERPEVAETASRIPNHWARTFAWAYRAGAFLQSTGLPWEKSLRNLELRARASVKVLQPMVDQTMKRVLAARVELTGETLGAHRPSSIQAAFSNVRLKPGTIGLTEPPTDRRPYTIVSISPEAGKKQGYLEQVVLHECIHIGVSLVGGKPHNDEFLALAEKLGLKEQFRD